MKTALIVSRSEKSAEYRALLQKSGFTDIETAVSYGEVRRFLAVREFDLIITEPSIIRGLDNRLRTLESEKAELRRKIEDIRIVDRAKCLIISHMSVSEGEAHRHIEKQAMDLRSTKRKVAESIIRTYEN